jgi:hypothetical protein
LAERNAETAALPDQGRQRLFEESFASAYDEERIGASRNKLGHQINPQE